MSRRVADTGSVTLPPNPEYLDFPRSDGSMSTWPPNTTRIVDHEGHLNYYEFVPLDEYQAIRWRIYVGEAVAKALEMPEGKNYILRSFPENYRLYDHNKGHQSNPRHDLYLFGPVKKRFRSINEFVPHAIWLFDPSENCACKYCGGNKSQKEITASMSNILRLTPSQTSPSPSRTKLPRDKGKGKESTKKEARRRDTRVYAAIQKVVKHLKPTPGVLKQPMLVERNNDLRAIYAETSMKLRRWYREGEVVWIALSHPIPVPDVNIKSAIEFWPAVIDEAKLKTETIPRDMGREGSSAPPAESQASSSFTPPDSATTTTTIADDTRGPIIDNKHERLPWTVLQSIAYRVQLLAVSHTISVDDDMVIPYQGYAPPDELINAMVAFPPDSLDFDKEQLAKFNPFPGPRLTPPTLFEAAPAFATALQIASIIAAGWCLTDSYEVRYSILPSPKSSPKISPNPLPSTEIQPSASQPPAPALTLEQALQEANRHNAQLSASVSYYRNATAINFRGTGAESETTVKRILGQPPSNLVQTRFQGLWWGAERIWAGDFVRLKIPRRTLAPKGGPHILAPSGAGRSAAEMWQELGRDPAQLGAGTRGIFLRLDNLVTVDIPTESGVSKKEARVCGMLYELADEDWEDPTEPKSVTPKKIIPGSTQQGPSANGSTPSHSGISESPIPSSLPQAPRGYWFRPILTPGYEFVGAMGLISGRYYPRILSHPKINPRVEAVLNQPIQENAAVGADTLWALEGLSGGYYNSMDPFKYKPSRIAMMQDADAEALQQLRKYKADMASEIQQRLNDADAMDVDS